MRGTPSYLTVAEGTLPADSMMKGLSGMDRTSAPPGPNMFDAGASSKVGVNNQPYNNERMMQQNILQNTAAAAPQANVGATQRVRKEQLVMDNAEYKANSFAEQRKGEVMDVLGSPNTLAMGNMSPPEAAQFRQNIATGKAMSMGVNPDLVAEEVSARRYG